MFQSRRTGSTTFVDLEDPSADGGSMKTPYSKPTDASKARLYTYIGGAVAVLTAIYLFQTIFVGGGLSHLRTDTFPDSFRLAVIADLDQSSKKEGKASWTSQYMTGTLRRKGESYDIVWDAPAEVSTAHNEAGRGCELSELIKFQDNLYTFDDRSGIMFQVMNPARSDAAEAPFLVPRNIFMEGPGDINDKGLKIEWATVKDSTLVVGSFGKEYTNSKGEIVHSNNLWSVAVKPDGTKAHVNWKPYYDAMRATLGYTSPGYFIHEAVVWSPHHRKWFVFPRRASKEAYDDVADEKRGSNMIIMASHDFKDVVSTTVGTITPERGFSSAKFLPGSHDSVVIALKSEENAAAGTQKTFFTIFGEVPGSGGSKWKVLLEEQPLPIEKKFEGLEVLSTTP